MEESGGDLGEGGEDEPAVVEVGMGEGEDGVMEDLGAVLADVKEEVEVNDAGALGGGIGAVAAHGLLDGEEGAEQVERGEDGFEEGGGVEEAGLVEVADGVGGVEGGDGGDVAEGGEAVQGFAEVGVGGAEGGGEVGAEGDSGGHAAAFGVLAGGRTGARCASEKQVPRCARNDRQKGKGKGKGKGKSKGKGKGVGRGISDGGVRG